MVSVLIVLALLFATPAWAGDHVYPPVCPDAERHDVCELKMQRNDAYDQIAVDREREAAVAGWWGYYANGAARTAEWWERYVSGVNDLMAAHPAGELEWWRSYAKGLDQQVAMWKEQCAKHHCIPQY